MSKQIIGKVKINIKAQQANPAPPIGSSLGPFGINIMGFCKEFNERTKSYEIGAPVPTEITIYQNKTFSFITKTLPCSYLIKKIMQDEKGVKYITRSQVRQIAEIKISELTSNTIDAAENSIIGTAKSMHIIVKD
jgi:large subunit ribosomal protein L11